MCQLCDVQKTPALIYNDGNYGGTILTNGISKFHFKLFPLKHQESFDRNLDIFLVTKKIIENLMISANTENYNILINLGSSDPFQHLSIDILPRFENDNVILKWIPNEQEKENLLEVSELLKNAFSDYVFKIEEEKKVIEKKEETKVSKNNEKFLFWKKVP
ncbi:MAG: hypothetical protein QXS41_03310 [Candidatus Woesearchaeota archaeon]